MGYLHSAMAAITGIEPVACPWRVYEDPVVQAGLALRLGVEKGVIDLDDQLAISVDAYRFINNIQNHVELVDLRAERELRESNQRLREAGR